MENDNSRNVSFFKFEDLRIYHKALEYIDLIYNASAMFPSTQGRAISDRFIASAQAIAFYIAEGSTRNKNQFVYYLKLAKSSVRECVVLTAVAEKQGLFNESMVEESRNYLMELTKMIGALIGSMQRNNPRMKDKENQEDLIVADSLDVRKY